MPAYDELIAVTHRERLEDPALARFDDAMARGVQYLINHPEEG